jgi:hypothetical protein
MFIYPWFKILITMDAIHFVQNYQYYLDEIKSVVRPDLFPIIEELKSIDAHDLVTPETWFPDEYSARGYVWFLFLKRVGRESSMQA